MLTHHQNHSRLRRAMKIAAAEGMLATASDNFAGPFLALFALSLGASRSQIGFLTAVPVLLTNLLQMPGAALAERWGHRKRLYVISTAVSRGLWLVVALLPWIVPADRVVASLILLMALRGMALSLGVPAWISLMSDITPRRIRGLYFSNRNFVANAAGLLAVLVGGWLARAVSPPGGYQTVYAMAALTGLSAAWVFGRFPEPDTLLHLIAPADRGRPIPPPLMERLRILARAITGDRQYLSYCKSSFFWNLAVTIPGPLFPIYFIEKLGGDVGLWGYMTGVTLAATMVGQRYWGPLTDRFGQRRIMAVSGIAAASLPLLWWLMPSAEPVLLINLWGGFAWAGYNLAAFNFLLEVTPELRRPTYVAGYNAVVGIASFLGPVLGGALAEWVDIRPVLILSAVLRALGLLVFLRVTKGMISTRMSMGWRDLLPGRRRTRRYVSIASRRKVYYH